MLLVVALAAGCAPVSAPERQVDAADARGIPDAACAVKDVARAPDGLVVWSPSGEQYIVNKKDAAGIYQLYVGNKGSSDATCITCTEAPEQPALNRHKLQPSWHPSGKWIVLAGERDDYKKPIISTPELIEGWVQSRPVGEHLHHATGRQRVAPAL